MKNIRSYLMDNGRIIIGIPYKHNSEKNTQILKDGCMIKKEEVPQEYTKEDIKNLYEKDSKKRIVTMYNEKIAKTLYTFSK